MWNLSSLTRDQTRVPITLTMGPPGKSFLKKNFIEVSVQFSCSVMSNSLWPHESQHARPPCPSPTPGVYINSCPSSRWCHLAISSSVVPFSSCPQALPASGSFPMSQLFTWGGQSTGVSTSASVLPMNTQDWSPLGWTGLVDLKCGVSFCYTAKWISYTYTYIHSSKNYFPI